jgi:hypothetical protein
MSFVGKCLMQIQYKKTPWWQRTFSLLCTLGADRLLRRRIARSRPDVMDEQGIQLGDGTKVEWGQFETIHNPLTTIENAEAERLVLVGNNRTVPVNFDQMVDGDQVREFFWDQWPSHIETLVDDLPFEIIQEEHDEPGG